MAILRSRERCYYGDSYSYYYCNSTWNDWGRWVALVVIVIAAFLIFFGLACLSARRRRRQGQQPLYGTGWAYRGPPGQWNQQPYPPAPPPQYTPSGGYYTGQQTGVELQAPQNVYQQPQNVYQPPTGPPPPKT